MRCNPVIRRLKADLADGAIGSVTTVNVEFGILGPTDPGHRLNDPAQAGGALLDLGVYPVSFAHLALGMPTVIAAVGARTDLGVDATTGMLLGYPSGSLATLSCSMRADSPITATISGTEGRIMIDGHFMRPSGYRVIRTGEAERVVEVAHRGEGYVHQAEEATRCLREGLLESPLVTWQDTLEVMTILDKVREQIGVSYAGE